METDVLIIGGGLSGLHSLYTLHKQGVACALLEGRDRIGGRVLSVHLDQPDNDALTPGFDLGPAWFWPGQQRMLSLVKELGLDQDLFAEAPRGASMYEDSNGGVQRGVSGGAMAGSYRMRGGIGQIVQCLRQSLPEDMIHTNSRVSNLTLGEGEVVTNLEDRNAGEWKSRYVIIAMPPRIALQTVQFSPELAPSRVSKLNDIATWMAGQAKIVALYDTPFWREQGLSGDAMSRHGPMQEIHDASPADGGPYALFGFVGVPAAHRRGYETELKAAAVAQLTRLFGEKAETPRQVHFKDWAFDAFTATERDRQPMHQHPSNNPGELAETAWDQRIIWSGTETAPMQGQNNGYLEGALEASEITLEILMAEMEHTPHRPC